MSSILVAHTKDEFVLKKDLEKAIRVYVNLVKKLLANADISKKGVQFLAAHLLF